MAILRDITLGQYFAANSFVHRLDPRTKILVIFAAMAVLVLLHDAIPMAIALIIIFAIIKASRVPVALVMRNLKPFLWLFLFTIFFHLLLSNDDSSVVTIPYVNLELSRTGLVNGALYSFRLALLILFAAMLTLTTSPMELTDALDRFFKPLQRFGIATHEFTMMITLSLRFIPTLIEEADKLNKAQISRGARFDGNLIQRVKSVIPLILPLFISVFRRADELALAMDARCYVGGNSRTSFKQLVFQRADYIVLFGTLILITLLIVT